MGGVCHVHHNWLPIQDGEAALHIQHVHVHRNRKQMYTRTGVTGIATQHVSTIAS